MEDHRIHRNELLALEPVDEKAGRVGVIEFGKLFLDQVQTFRCPAVIILVVTDDQPFGHSFDSGWVAGKWFHFEGHGSLRLGQHINGNLVEARDAIGLCPERNFSRSGKGFVRRRE
jgi:hypothetical protein